MKPIILQTIWHKDSLAEKLMTSSYVITDQCKTALDLYISHGIPPGHFLTAVICNDLLGATGHANNWNSTHIKNYVDYLFNEAPGNCWGSTEAMQQWMEKFK